MQDTFSTQKLTYYNKKYIKNLIFFTEIPETYFRVTRPLDEEKYGVMFSQCGPDWDEDTTFKYWIFKVVVFYLLPLLFISIAYTKIVLILWKSNKEHSRGSN